MKLHHTGFIVDNIGKFESNLIFQQKVGDVTDPVQKSRLCLYRNFGDSFIELIEPLNQDAFTYNFLAKNGAGFHHFCYEIDSSDEVDQLVSARKLILVKGPIPALLFNNRMVSFYYTRNKQIVEFLFG